MKTTLACLLAGLLLMVPTSSAWGQDFNVDFSSDGDSPAATYAGAGSAGTWNGVAPQSFGGPAAQLVDIDGNATGVTLSNQSQASASVWTYPDALMAGDDAELLEDGFTALDIPGVMRFQGLTPGAYRVIAYGLFPTLPNTTTSFINLGAGCGGAWPGSFQEGVSHVETTLAVGQDGRLEIHWVTGNPFGTSMFSGVQISRIWTNLEGGSAGVNGVPKLTGFGPMTAGSTIGVELSSGPPSSPALLWIALNPTAFGALGGTVHAYPYNAQLLVFTSPSGNLGGATTMPAVVSGTAFTFQFLCQDVTTVHGITLSNAARGTVP